MGRPKADRTAKDKRKEMTLESHPAWLTFEDVQHLLRLYLGHGFGRPIWLKMVATGKIPGYTSLLSPQVRYKWEEVVTAVEGSMRPVFHKISSHQPSGIK